MKNIAKQLSGFVALLLLFTTTGCADTFVEEHVTKAPVITSFSPQEVLSGEDTPIVIFGENLQAVDKALIGGREVRILERVSNTRMSIIATKEARSGAITLSNSVGSSASQATVTVNYPVPVLNTAELPADVEMFGDLTLKGTYMGVIRSVILTADGQTEGHAAEIKSQSATEVVIRVPYVENANARLTMTYMEADDEISTPIESAPAINVIRLTPTVTLDVDHLTVGRITTLTGTNLDQINSIEVKGQEANISKQSATEVKFTVPMIEGFTEGTSNEADLKIVYFDGYESAMIRETIPATVLAFKIWEGVTTFCQANTCIRLESFFSPETGKVYHNSLWSTEIDPLSYERKGDVCSAVNVPKVTEAEYNSVIPYFFFGGNTGTAGATNYCTLQLNSPAGSNGQLKNFNADNTNKNRLLPGNGYGTPALTFRYLDPGNATEAALANKIRNLDFLSIDETTFPIDVDAQTVAGVNMKTLTGSTNSSVWAPGVFTPGVTSLDTPVDAVLLVLYYTYEGMTDGLKHVKRLGFVHIVSANYRPLNGVAPSLSDVTYNVYWQKEDYKY